MKQEYDFSDAQQGRFYRGGRPYQVVINVSSGTEDAQYEVFQDSEGGGYRFRLRSDATVLFTSDTTYASKDECLEAIAAMRHASVLAPTVFAS